MCATFRGSSVSVFDASDTHHTYKVRGRLDVESRVIIESRAAGDLFTFEQVSCFRCIRMTFMATHDPPVLYSVDLGECEALAALSVEDIVCRFVAALERAGATVVQELSHAFPGVGLTSVLILSES